MEGLDTKRQSEKYSLGNLIPEGVQSWSMNGLLT